MLRNINLIKRLIMSYNNRILKFQSGGKYFAANLKKAGNRAFGQPLYYDKRTGDLIQIASEDALTRDGWSKGEVVRTGKEMQNGPYNVFNITGWVPIGAYKGTSQVRQKQSNGIEVDGKKYASVSDWRKEQTARQPVATNAVNTKTSRTSKPIVKATPKGQAYWNSQYQDFKDKMTDDQKAWLAQRGIDYSSAEKMQDYLQRIGKKNIGKFGVDNKWGSDSQTAWNNFVATTMKNNPLQTPVEDQPVIDAPDPFGYKTSNTYEDNDFANKLKGMGIKSNADLMHFMYESGKEGWKGNAWQTQFRNDVDKALGGDYSDDNIRRVFKTKNDWGRGFLGGGDFSDFQNALQTNAGVWNGMYEQKQNNARMDAARKQYADKLAQQYTPQLSKSSLNKPMIGNIGINTIGNQPGLSDIWAGPDGLV